MVEITGDTFLATLFALVSLFGTWAMIRGERSARIDRRSKFTATEWEKYDADNRW